MIYTDPFLHSLNPTFLAPPQLTRIMNEYPVQEIKDYCANPEVSEHQSSLWGNYSAPVDPKDWVVHNIQHNLNTIVYQFTTSAFMQWDHHYVNYHMDEPGSHLECHNDLKNFRWLITSQIYLDADDQGVWLCDRRGNQHKKIPQIPGQLYSIWATPYSWHMVDELTKLKRSILFRVGKRRHKTVAHPDVDKPAWIIVNDGHDDTHYAKLAERMGNYTEAHLYSLGHRNIYHTNWRSGDLNKVENYVKDHHFEYEIINSGDFIGWGNYTITNDNYEEMADFVFGRRRYSSMWNHIENNMHSYYSQNLQLHYQDIVL